MCPQKKPDKGAIARRLREAVQIEARLGFASAPAQMRLHMAAKTRGCVVGKNRLTHHRGLMGDTNLLRLYRVNHAVALPPDGFHVFERGA